MEIISNDILREKIYYNKSNNGLDIYFMPKKGFTKKYAVLATNYGSNEVDFIPIGKTDRVRVNEGIAHFLEHKMFEQPDEKNAFEAFAKWGASANAFTNFTMTAYLFSTTENFYKCLAHLIDYVQTPHFTDENVNKEKGIIEQEIKMYHDDPYWNCYFNCLRLMYVNHPVKDDIAGSVESINKITKEELYECYNTFYNPGNMALFIVGDLDNEEIVNTVNHASKYNKEIDENVQKFYPKEPEHVKDKEHIEKYEISIPSFNIGFKDTNVGIKGELLLRKEIITEIIIDMVFKKGTPLYEEMYMSGLINESFGTGFSSQIDYAFAIVGGESKDPKKVLETVIKYLEKYKVKGLNKEDFERSKKKKIGNFLKYFDSVSFISNNFLVYKFKDINLLDYLDVIKDIKFDELDARLKELFKEENSVISIVEPK